MLQLQEGNFHCILHLYYIREGRGTRTSEEDNKDILSGRCDPNALKVCMFI